MDEKAEPNPHRGCFICGDLNPNSLGLSFSSCGECGVQAAFFASERYQGYAGIIHGGVISSLLDAAMTHRLFEAGIEGVTADLQVRFVHPIPCNTHIEVKADLVAARNPLFRLRSELTLHERVMARGQARFVARKGVI